MEMGGGQISPNPAPRCSPPAFGVRVCFFTVFSPTRIGGGTHTLNQRCSHCGKRQRPNPAAGRGSSAVHTTQLRWEAGAKFLLAFIRHPQRDVLRYGRVCGRVASCCLQCFCSCLARKELFGKCFFAGQSSTQVGLLGRLLRCWLLLGMIKYTQTHLI